MSILPSLIEPISSLLDKFVENKDQKNLLAHRIATMAERHAHELAKGQLEVNKVEAAHNNMFVAGWRPAVGWICAMGMAGNFILIPMANFILALVESEIVIPLIALSEMMPVLLGMLGLGAMRTVEKAKGVQRDK
jgi:hypothetical protein|tara:strand:+ start:84 stop:488 length:405 start_codon:yes stop_codon:yes gene_type:complete